MTEKYPTPDQSVSGVSRMAALSSVLHKVSFGGWLAIVFLTFWASVFIHLGPPSDYANITPISVSAAACAAVYFSWRQAGMAELLWREKFLDKRLEIVEPIIDLRRQIKKEKVIKKQTFDQVSDATTRMIALFPHRLSNLGIGWINEVRREMKPERSSIAQDQVVYHIDDEISSALSASALVPISLLLVEAGVRPKSRNFD